MSRSSVLGEYVKQSLMKGLYENVHDSESLLTSLHQKRTAGKERSNTVSEWVVS